MQGIKGNFTLRVFWVMVLVLFFFGVAFFGFVLVACLVWGGGVCGVFVVWFGFCFLGEGGEREKNRMQHTTETHL